MNYVFTASNMKCSAVVSTTSMSTVSSLFLSFICFAEQPPGDAGAAKPTTAIEDFKVDARQYVMRLDARPDTDLELREEPLFHWSNPARLGEDGAVFVWL